MKAYIARLVDDEWQMLVHGETRGKAAGQFCHDNPPGFYAYEIWNDIRLTRLPEWDDRKFDDCDEIRDLFSYENYDENGDEIQDPFINDCTCRLCRPF
jgi:hypothetical protein